MCPLSLPFAFRTEAWIVAVALRRSFVICPLRKRRESTPVTRNFVRTEKSKNRGESELRTGVIGDAADELNRRSAGARNRPTTRAALHLPLLSTARGR